MATKNAENTDEELNDVEIFRAGTYQVIDANGDKRNVSYSADDVKQLAENGNSLISKHSYEAPAKLGHSEKQTVRTEAGLPAAGWVKSLRAKGGTLLADFKQVPAKLAEAIRRGRYKYVSSEIYDPEDTKRNFGDFGIKGFTLRAVAFLGADVPVVKGLKPLMLSDGSDGARTITIDREEVIMTKLAEEKAEPLMVPANKHPYGALVKHKDDKAGEVHKVIASHADGTYDTMPLHGDNMGMDKIKKAVPHENLTLLSEAEYTAINKENDMDAAKFAEVEKKANEAAAALAAERATTKRLMEERRDEKIAAFAEKHKVYGFTAALKPAFEAVAKMEVATPVKLAEGKEVPYLDAFLSFAEAVIESRKVILGEVTPATGSEAPKEDAVKLAELPLKAYAELNHMEISGADMAVKARKYAEENKVTYREALLAVAATKENK